MEETLTGERGHLRHLFKSYILEANGAAKSQVGWTHLVENIFPKRVIAKKEDAYGLFYG